MNRRVRDLPRWFAPWLVARALVALALFVIWFIAAGGTAVAALVSLDTHRLYIHCEGTGTPVAVLDVGLGGTSREWSRVQRLLSQHTEVCVYDRSGYGHSDPGPPPRTSSRIVEELRALLERAAVPTPYVLVGHSFGGYTAQLFAKRYAGVTAGVALIDSSHPEQMERLPIPPTRLNTAPDSRHRIAIFFAPNLPRNLTQEARVELGLALKRPHTRATLIDEHLEFQRSAREVQAGGPFPPLPLIVLTRGERAWPPGERGDVSERIWMELQSELAQLSPLSAHIVARRSAHYIHLDQPDLVAAAIKLVVDAARAAPGNYGVHLGEDGVDPSLAPAEASWCSNHLLGELNVADSSPPQQIAGVEVSGPRCRHTAG
ncbi:MAG: alpha/beta fold hydrolase [Chromatiales bacterium]